MKKAIVIGATSGIGKELARILVSNGYRVGITGRRTALLHELNAENPAAYVTKTFDVTDFTTIPNTLQELITELGGLDLLVLSSGTGDLNEALDFEIEKRTIDTNILGFTCIADWTFNYFEQQKSGHLVAISSIGGLRGSRVAPSYNASKAYQINYLEGLRQKANQLKFPLHVTDIRPGFVDTDMAKGDGKFWVATPHKAASQIFRAITKHKKVAYITRRWKIIAMVFKLIPGSIYAKM